MIENLENHLRAAHPEAFEKWDGHRIRLIASETRKPDRASSMTVTLFNKEYTHATFVIDTETEKSEVHYHEHS